MLTEPSGQVRDARAPGAEKRPEDRDLMALLEQVVLQAAISEMPGPQRALRQYYPALPNPTGGRLEVTLAMLGNALSLQILCASREIEARLREGMGPLRERLAQRGLELDAWIVGWDN